MTKLVIIVTVEREVSTMSAPYTPPKRRVIRLTHALTQTDVTDYTEENGDIPEGMGEAACL